MKPVDETTKRLVAVGASVGANCHPCLEYHIGRAREAGIGAAEIRAAVEVARAVRGGATAGIDLLATKLLGDGAPGQAEESSEPCCCCS